MRELTLCEYWRSKKIHVIHRPKIVAMIINDDAQIKIIIWLGLSPFVLFAEKMKKTCNMSFTTAIACYCLWMFCFVFLFEEVEVVTLNTITSTEIDKVINIINKDNFV